MVRSVIFFWRNTSSKRFANISGGGCLMSSVSFTDIMADILNKDEQWKSDQLNNFNTVAKNYTLN